MPGTAILNLFGSSTRCDGALLLRQNQIRRIWPLPNLRRRLASVSSSARRMSITFTSRLARSSWCICMGNSSKAGAIPAYVPPSMMPRRTNLLLRFRSAHAADGFVLTSAGSEKCRFEMERIYSKLMGCSVFIAIGTSGQVEPAASFVAGVAGRARTLYVGPEEPANSSSFSEIHLGKAGEVVPGLFGA